MHLCIIKKTNLIQEVPQAEAPKIHEVYQSLSHLVEHRLMYTLLCFLAQEGCKMEANYKGARVFDWIPEQEIRDLILSHEAKSRPVPAERVVGGGGETNELGDLYNNIEVLHLTNVDVSSSFTDTGKKHNL